MLSYAQLSNILKISRPRFYSYLFGPFIVGAAAGISSIQQLYSPLFIGLLLFFIFPANLFLYGINDYFDNDTDQFNQKKKSQEHLLQQKERKILLLLLIIAAGMALAFCFWLPSTSRFLLLLFLFLSTFYSAPPIRFKARPFLDAYSNVLYILPGLIGYQVMTDTIASLITLVAAWAWAVGMHTFSAIPDIIPDKKAGITTTAVLLGTTKALWFVGIHWSIFAAILMYTLGNWGVIGLVYPTLIGWIMINKTISINNVYWWFPLINTIVGFFAFWYFLFPILQ